MLVIGRRLPNEAFSRAVGKRKADGCHVTLVSQPPPPSPPMGDVEVHS